MMRDEGSAELRRRGAVARADESARDGPDSEAPRGRAGRPARPAAAVRPSPAASGYRRAPTRTASGAEPSPVLRKSPAHWATNRLVPRRTRQLVVNAPLAAVRTVWCCQRDEPGGSMLTVTRSLPRAGVRRPVMVIVAGRLTRPREFSVIRLARPASPPVREDSRPAAPPSR